MTTKLNNEDELVQQQDAVKVYLAALLNDGPDVNETDQLISDNENSQKTVVASLQSEKQKNKSSALNDVLPKTNFVKELIEDNQEQSKYFVPSWASSRFACSMIHVAGLSFLIPTQFIRGVRRISQPLSPVTKNVSWVKGRYRKNFENIIVIDTKFLAYGREEFIPPKHKADRDVYIVVVGNGQWGLSCESIGHGINLTNKQVSWRGKQGKRRWLAGTSVDNKSAIVDVRRMELFLIMDGVLV